MKSLLFMSCLFLTSTVFANTWTVQVNVNGNPGSIKKIDSDKATFEAGAYDCEVTPMTVQNETEYRTLICSVGSGTVSTGGLCTKKSAKFASVQYAILNLAGPKNVVNVVVACKFD